MNKGIILLGVILIAIGLFWPIVMKIPFGRFPGDILIKRDGFTFYLPITTCLLISAVVSLIFWFFRK